MKDNKRLIRNAAQGHQFEPVGSVGHPPLDKTYVHLDRSILQPLEIFQGSLRGKNLQGDTAASQDVAILIGVGLEGTAVRACGDDESSWRRGVHEPENA